MLRFAGIIVFCFVSAFAYGQENLNFNPKFQTGSTEKEATSKNDDEDFKNQKLKVPMGLNVRLSRDLVKQMEMKSDSVARTPRKEEAIEKKEDK